MDKLPKPETMLAYASILEKPQYVVKGGIRYIIPTGEIIEAACAALRYCATQQQNTYTEVCMNEKCPRGCGTPVEVIRP